MERRMEHLRPAEIEAAMSACPTLLQPIGTVEWHGLHNITGLDALKAQALCIRAAERAGCLVAPPVFGGIGGLDEPHTFVMDPDDGYDSRVVRGWYETLCKEAHRQGFRAMVLLTGHYGAGQQILVRETAVRMSRLLHMPVLGTPEYFLALDEGYTGDHAAFFETSLMMELDPDSVRLDRLADLKEGESHQGVGGRDPKKHATRADGARLAEAMVGRLAALAQAMPTWDDATLARFIAAEQALVDRQMSLAGETGHVWAAWRKIPQGAFAAYPRLLTEGRFEEIVALVQEL